MRFIDYISLVAFTFSHGVVFAALTPQTNATPLLAQPFSSATTSPHTTLSASASEDTDPPDPLGLTPPFTKTPSEMSLPGDEHIVWDKRPLSIVIPTGKERLITFPEPVEFINTSPELTADKMTVLNNAGTLYIKAIKPFDPVRVQVRLSSNGQVILLDLSSAPSNDDAPLDVIIADEALRAGNDRFATTPDEPLSSVNYVDLLRFAVQTLYAPLRLVTQSPDIVRTPMYTQHSVTLFYGATTIAYPVISWSGGDLFVTAVIVKNRVPRAITLDPRQAIGVWKAMVLYPTNRLAPAGSVHAQTTAFLISDRPFGRALSGVSQGDPAWAP